MTFLQHVYCENVGHVIVYEASNIFLMTVDP